MTSSGDVISRKKLHGHVRDKILGKVTDGIFKICYGSGVMQQKVGLGVNLPPPLVLCVLKICRGIYTRALYSPLPSSVAALIPDNFAATIKFAHQTDRSVVMCSSINYWYSIRPTKSCFEYFYNFLNIFML